MIKIVKEKGQGKTIEIIKKSSELSIPILTMNHRSRESIKNMAKKMGLDILEPITILEIENGKLSGLKISSILVDDIDSIMQQYLSSKQIEMIGFSITK